MADTACGLCPPYMKTITGRKHLMKQLLVKLSDEEYEMLENYCKKAGKTKSGVIRHQIFKLREDASADLATRKIARISPGKGKLVSDLVREMRD